MERMGPNSPLLNGEPTRPTLGAWDVKEMRKIILKINDLVGRRNGITCGAKILPKYEPTIESLTAEKILHSKNHVTVLTFDPDNYPIEKVPEYVSYCQDQIHFSKGQTELYRLCLQTLSSRLENEGGDIPMVCETAGKE
ncbi:hypothetical protein LIER_39038 [Lithospermum erythrorhizon]|uniref:Uncharacterized protein n=1 Tax=Lithospermum erythrorhizon TaxID=34254 RepID=A0AAV3QAM8_LITER